MQRALRATLAGQTPWGRRSLTVSLAVATGALLVALFLWVRANRSAAQLEGMDPATRAQVFAQTREAFRLACEPQPSAALQRRCRSEARFLQRFPECDQACQAELSPFLFAATK